MSDQNVSGSSSKKIASELTKITAFMENQSLLHLALKAPTVTPLKAPGPESNYLDWVFVLRVHFCLRDVFYILEPTIRSTKPLPGIGTTWLLSPY
jgi:hypothetical protein